MLFHAFEKRQTFLPHGDTFVVGVGSGHIPLVAFNVGLLAEVSGGELAQQRALVLPEARRWAVFRIRLEVARTCKLVMF